jgi:hypothetical protein
MSKVINLPVSCALGEAHTDDGRHYKVAVGRERLMLQSRQTGCQTAMSWDDLVAVASRAGLDLDGDLGGPDAAA